MPRIEIDVSYKRLRRVGPPEIRPLQVLAPKVVLAARGAARPYPTGLLHGTKRRPMPSCNELGRQRTMLAADSRRPVRPTQPVRSPPSNEARSNAPRSRVPLRPGRMGIRPNNVPPLRPTLLKLARVPPPSNEIANRSCGGKIKDVPQFLHAISRACKHLACRPDVQPLPRSPPRPAVGVRLRDPNRVRPHHDLRLGHKPRLGPKRDLKRDLSLVLNHAPKRDLSLVLRHDLRSLGPLKLDGHCPETRCHSGRVEVDEAVSYHQLRAVAADHRWFQWQSHSA